MQGSLNSMVVWVPLVDIPKNLGALEIIPGSHLDGLHACVTDDQHMKMAPGEVDDDDFVSVETELGDALFFSSFLVHRSGNNTTNNIRWSCHFRYNDLAEQSFIDRGYPYSFLYKPQCELLTPNFPRVDDVRGAFALE